MPDPSRMLISYVPGEECRVAIVEDGKLEELHAERASAISRVGNIYVGTVTNVEPAIQAAFVDFGVEHHGFLHVSDIHPRYFPGEDDETTEMVGKKTPRRDRPPIQKCFRRGDEVTVQVLKEGVGTKGPTLTSYLSIPGRYLVMMPQMDRVGVSRKVEDEDQRREMRAVLDQLELPDGFGFILRTAGMDRNKTELKRDLAYLMRLWKDMETRLKSGQRPRLLYSESDLLVRALRDILSPDITEVVIDNELALVRASRFLKIVAPRSKVKLLQFQSQTPLFHAFGIEQQLAMMNAREVPLPSGGRLVIDETEALVAIDVNSGKMRDARDAETNAYRTNCEAVDEICRQLKLRDLGGIVINDLIDMRHASHRKDIEQRFRDRLKRDRARTTTLAISDFGILEMTRQRMRGSHETVHFADCPTCHGRGIVQKPDSVTGDALRSLAALLDIDKVGRVEMVVSPPVAGQLLSGRRKTLNKLERTSGKQVDVRVSETVPLDRVTFYAYDPTGADIDVTTLPKPKAPKDLKVWELLEKGDDEAWAVDTKAEEAPPEPDLTPAEQAELADAPPHPIEIDEDAEAPAADGEPGQGKKRRRRRRGRGRGRGDQPADPAAPTAQQPGAPHAPTHTAPPQPQHADRGPRTAPLAAPAAQQGPLHLVDGDADDSAGPIPAGDGAQGEPGEGGRRRRRRRRRRGRGGAGGNGLDGPAPNTADAPVSDAEFDDAPPPQPIPLSDLDPEAPRGDSWDLPASAVRPLPAPRPAARPPAPVAPIADAVPADADLDAPDSNFADNADDSTTDAPGTPADTDNPQPGTGAGGRKRRRRRGGRGRGGPKDAASPNAVSPDAAPSVAAPSDARPPVANAAPPPALRQPLPPPRQPAAPVVRAPIAPAPRPIAPPPPRDPPRLGGGYQKRGPETPLADAPPPPQPASPPLRQASPPREPAPPPPARGPQPEPKPKRFLYTSRRRLGPGEIPKNQD
ncbi:MAG: Rne/Rng family ribonuclease [Phycisphaerales bacterium]